MYVSLDSASVCFAHCACWTIAIVSLPLHAFAHQRLRLYSHVCVGSALLCSCVSVSLPVLSPQRLWRQPPQSTGYFYDSATVYSIVIFFLVKAPGFFLKARELANRRYVLRTLDHPLACSVSCRTDVTTNGRPFDLREEGITLLIISSYTPLPGPQLCSFSLAAVAANEHPPSNRST